MCMKTAISIPDKVFNSAEKLADRLGKTRSQLYTQAISSYISKHKTDDVTKKLDEIYTSESSVLDPDLSTIQSLSIPREGW
jgi:metal-responsive CopG/Arc/MetJ family transcriptional regulator